MAETDGKHLTESPMTADPELVELVAYLDGELDGLAVDAMEQRLVTDEPLRHRAELLDRTWRMLDALGETTASGEFTARTLASMSAASLAPAESVLADGQPAAASGRQTQLAMSTFRVLLCFTLSLLMTTAGLWLGRWYFLQSRNPQDVQMLQQLDLLEQYFLYRPIPSVRFLQELELRPQKTSNGDTP